MDWWVVKLAYSVLLIGLCGLLARWEYHESQARGSERPRLRAWLIVIYAVLAAACFSFETTPRITSGWLLIAGTMLPGYMLTRWERRSIPAAVSATRKDQFRILLMMGFLVTTTGMLWLYQLGIDGVVWTDGNRSEAAAEHAMIMLIFLGVGFGLRIVLAMCMAMMVDSGPYPLPRGNRLLLGSAALLGVVLVIVVGRLILGGYSMRDFTLHGGLAPAGTYGWRVDEIVRRQIGSHHTLSEIPRGPDVPLDGVCKPRCNNYEGLHSTPGIKIRVAGQPVNLVYSSSEKLTYRLVRRRHPLIATNEQYHFAQMPRKGRAGCQESTVGWVLVGARIDGKQVIVKLCHGRSKAVKAEEILISDVGLLLRPPLLPLIFGLVFTGLGILLLWWSARLWRAGSDHQRIGSCQARIASSLVFFETAIALIGSYFHYF